MQWNKNKIKAVLSQAGYIGLLFVLVIGYGVTNYFLFKARTPRDINAVIIIDDGYLYFYNVEKETMQLRVNPGGSGIIFAVDEAYFHIIPVAIPSMCGVKIPLEFFFTIDTLKQYKGDPQTVRVAIDGRDKVFIKGKHYSIPGQEAAEKKGLGSLKRLEKRGYIFVVPEIPVNKNMII